MTIVDRERGIATNERLICRYIGQLYHAHTEQGPDGIEFVMDDGDKAGERYGSISRLGRFGVRGGRATNGWDLWNRDDGTFELRRHRNIEPDAIATAQLAEAAPVVDSAPEPAPQPKRARKPRAEAATTDTAEAPAKPKRERKPKVIAVEPDAADDAVGDAPPDIGDEVASPFTWAQSPLTEAESDDGDEAADVDAAELEEDELIAV